MPANQLTLKDLKSHLWNCAQILRGSAVDRTDWKGYILPLLFFKRISDVWDEETAEAREAFEDIDLDDFPELHRFTLPDGCHWRDVRETPASVGTALARAMRAIERANPDTLTRVFGAADWGNREMLGDELLKDLIAGLSVVPLGNTAVGSDILGDAYEYLVGKFADITRRKKAGEFYTPRSVVRMMVELLDPREGESIYDPACGTGGMLLGAIEHVERAGGDPRTFFGRIFGEEKNLTTSSIARMNLVLHGVDDFRIEQNDTLRDPAFTDTSGALATFDCVIANPPFSLKEWGREVWEADPWGRAAFGLPPASYGDYAWVQQMVASMAADSGRMAVVLPQGALFRKGAEGRIRRALLEQDLIEAVIGLAPNIFYGTGLAPAVVTLRRAKRRGRRRKVIVIDASSLFRKGRAQNFLDPAHAEQTVRWVRRFRDVEDRAKVVSTEDIEGEDWTLNISRYVLPLLYPPSHHPVLRHELAPAPPLLNQVHPFYPAPYISPGMVQDKGLQPSTGSLRRATNRNEDLTHRLHVLIHQNRILPFRSLCSRSRQLPRKVHLTRLVVHQKGRYRIRVRAQEELLQRQRHRHMVGQPICPAPNLPQIVYSPWPFDSYCQRVEEDVKETGSPFWNLRHNTMRWRARPYDCRPAINSRR